MSAVLQLPVTSLKGAEMEPILVGAALRLRIDAATFGLVALEGAEFRHPVWQLAWRITRRKAEHHLDISPEEVYIAGAKANRWPSPKVMEDLLNAEAASSITLEQFKRACRDFRLLAQGIRTAAALRAEAQRIEGGYFDPAVTAGRLSGLQNELHGAEDLLIDLTEAQERVFIGWEKHEREKTSALLTTGIKVLDDETGGLPKEFCLLVADAGVGKTAFQDSLLGSLVDTHRELKCLLVSPEDGPEHVIERWTARDMNWLLRDVGSKHRSPEQERVSLEIKERHFDFLRRIFGHSKRGLTIDRLISILWKANQEHGCEFASIDNWNKLKLGGLQGSDLYERVQDASDKLQDFAQRAKMTVLMLVHSTEELGKNNSATGGMQGGRSVGRDARFRLDLFRKGTALRGRIAKANKQAEQGTVLEFDRLAQAGLIDPDSGRRVDVAAETRAEREEREDAQLARAMARAAKRKSLEAKAKASAAPPPPEEPAQAALPLPEDT